MSLIVNADDFGISEDVNCAIAECFEQNLIQRTTLMCNMPYAKEAMELAVQRGFADKVGVHLNLTAGMPLTNDIRSNRLFCNQLGEFNAAFCHSLRYRFLMNAESGRQMQKELDAQLERYIELGGTLRHVDSHHHVHTNPSVLKTLIPLLKKYDVKSVRYGRNMYHGGNILMKLFKVLLNRRLLKFNLRSGFFGSMKDMENYIVEEGAKAGEWANRNSVEVMVHPMHDRDGRLVDNTNEEVVEMKKIALLMGEEK